MNGSGSQYQDLLNNAIVYTDVLNLSGMDANSVPYIDANQNLADYVLTNGQLVIGSTGAAPKASTITGSSNLIVTNGSGSVSIDTVQPIQTTSSVTFGTVTATTGLTLPYVSANAVIATNASSEIIGATLTNGQLVIGNTGTIPTLSTLTGTSNEVIVTNGAGTITLSTPQPIATSSSPTFAQVNTNNIIGVTGADLTINAHSVPLPKNINLATNVSIANVTIGLNSSESSFVIWNGSDAAFQTQGVAVDTYNNVLDDGVGNATVVSLTDTGLTTNSLVSSSSGGLLQDTTITNTNGSNGSFTGSVLTLSNSQNLGVTGTPTFADLTLTNTTNQLILGTTKTITINSVAPASSEIITIGDPGGAATFALINSGTAPVNGALLIGNGTHSLKPATISSTANINITNGAGSLGIDTIQGIGGGASPSFTGLTLSGLTNAILCTSGGGLLESMGISTSNGITESFTGGALTLSLSQNLQTTGNPVFNTITPTNGITMGCSVYQTGTISQTGTTVTGSGTTFTSAMVGGQFYSTASGSCTITAFSSTTSITVAVSQTIPSSTNYIIFYNAPSSTGSFAVGEYGNIYHSVVNTNADTTTCDMWQFQNTGGNSSLAFDYQTYSGFSGNAPNARMTVTDDNYGGSFRWWARVQGADTHALQTNFSVLANRSVSSSNNTLDDSSGNMIIAGSLTSSKTTNQIVLGTTATTTIDSIAPASSRVITIPDGLGATNMVLSGQATITQLTNITTGVTISSPTGVITTVSTTTAALTTNQFTVTNTFCTAASVVTATLCNYSGTYITNGIPHITVQTVGSGSFKIAITNMHASNALNGILKISFIVC